MEPAQSLPSKQDDTMHETIAVVDDEPDILELVSLHLRKNHFSVREFSDGSSFIKYLDSEKPDLVVLDLMLPDADGFEICKYMKRKKIYHIRWPLTNYEHMLIINTDRSNPKWQGREIVGEWVPCLNVTTLSPEVFLFPCWKRSF